MTTADTSKKPAPRSDWHKADIKAALEKLGYSTRSFARSKGYSRSAVSKALRMPYPAMEALIAEAIGTSVTEIWPTRYDATGRPLHGRPVANPTSRGGERNVSGQRGA